MNIGGLYEQFQDLQARVAQLESESQASEALVPNSYTIDANGNVVVSGVDLPAGTTSTPPATDRVRWIRTSDGAVVADLSGFSTAGLEVLALNAYATAIPDQSDVIIAAQSDLGPQATVTVQQINRGATAQILLTALPETAVLLRQDGASDFVMSNTSAATATAGTQTLPAKPAGFLVTTAIGGATVKIPFYLP